MTLINYLIIYILLLLMTRSNKNNYQSNENLFKFRYKNTEIEN